jgi:hypothetical protein
MKNSFDALLIALGVLLAPTLTAKAADPPDDVATTVSHDAKVAGEKVKHGAKVVAEAAKEGAKQIAVAAKEVAHDVAVKSKEGAQEVSAAAKRGAAKTKAAVKGAKTDKSDEKPANEPAR